MEFPILCLVGIPQNRHKYFLSLFWNRTPWRRKAQLLISWSRVLPSLESESPCQTFWSHNCIFCHALNSLSHSHKQLILVDRAMCRQKGRWECPIALIEPSQTPSNTSIKWCSIERHLFTPFVHPEKETVASYGTEQCMCEWSNHTGHHMPSHTWPLAQVTHMWWSPGDHQSWHTLGLFTAAIFRPFSAHFQFSFFFHFLKMNFRMSQKWTEKWLFLKNWTLPLLLQKWSFSLSFSHPIFVSLSNSTPMCNLLQWPPPSMMMPSPSPLYHHHNSVTTCCHHTHAHFHIDWCHQPLQNNHIGVRERPCSNKRRLNQREKGH